MTDRVEVAIGIFIAYFIAFAIPTGIIGRVFSIHKEIIRKIYHIFGSASMILLLYVFPGWKSALGSFLGIFILAYGLILLFQDREFFKRFRIDRKKDDTEIKQQIIYVAMTYTFLILSFWAMGGEENKHFILFGVMTWCLGDSFAAIFGRLYGKKNFRHPLIDQNKTHIGFKAFILPAATVNLGILMIFYSFPWGINVAIAGFLGLVGGIIELISKKGLDNVVIPIGITFLAYAVINGVLMYY